MNNKPAYGIAVTAFAASLLVTSPVQAQDEESGQSLHDTNCVACHDSTVYTRETRRVGNREALETQVTRCENNLGLQWFDEQRDAVTDYLNHSYYHF